MKTLIIEPHYLPNIRYFELIKRHQVLILDDTSLFQKQSYRNRACILSANGVQPLIIPLCQGKTRLPFRDVRIDNKHNWQRIHRQAIRSAYNKSSFFLYYQDQLEPIFQKNYTFLVDVNLELIQLLAGILEIDLKYHLYDGMQETAGLSDYRNQLHPKEKFNKGISTDKPKPYYQVFSDRFGFVQDLSVIDLLFNTGPEATSYLGY
jgi:hypothetical protein